MKKFLIKILLFLLPLSIFFIEGFLPYDSFTFRPWESLLFKSNRSFFFYPNTQIDMISTGDLCHHTPNAIKRNEKWIVDDIGFRNNKYIENPDILLIGDSFIAGSSITQDSTLVNQLSQDFNNSISIYAIAPASFSDFVAMHKKNIFETPKLIIFSKVERVIPEDFNSSVLPNINYKQNISHIDIIIDKIKRHYMVNYLISRLLNSTGNGVRGKNNSHMFFINGINQEYDPSYCEKTLKIIKKYKKYCDKINVEFLFLPIPNKETVYYDYAGFEKQPNNLSRLVPLFNKNQINIISAIDIYNKHREESNELLYQLDDTHWNTNGIKLISSEIKKYIESNNIIK